MNPGTLALLSFNGTAAFLYNAIVSENDSDVHESFLSSQSHKPFDSESSQSRLKFFRVRVESQKPSSHFESLVCKLESMSRLIKFHIFSITFITLRNGAQDAIRWCPIS